MQPSEPNSSGLVSALPSFPQSRNAPGPRQRNRLHNRAVKHAKATAAIHPGIGLLFQAARNADSRPPREDGVPTTQTELDFQPERVAIVSSPRLTVTSGGLRGDPFSALPIAADGKVHLAVDYFLQHYAPVHINPRKEHLGPTDSLVLSRRYFALAMQNTPLFELMVALATASHAARQGNGSQPTKQVLIHHGKGLEALRIKMASSFNCDDDATILAVMALLGIALMYSDFTSFEMHLIGLRHLVQMRGGVDNLGWNGFIRNSITGLESLWAYHENKKLSIATTETKFKLEYPRHPFPPELCNTIAKFPEGFREVALAATLNLQLLAVLSGVTEWVKQMQSGWKKDVLPVGEPNGTYMKQTHLCLEMVPLPKLTVLERVLCVALATMTTETFNKNQQHNPVHKRLIESLAEMLCRYDLRWLPADCSIWLALIIAGPLSSQAEGDTQRRRHILLDTIVKECSAARKWLWVEKTVRNFFFSEALIGQWKKTWDVALQRYIRLNQEIE